MISLLQITLSSAFHIQYIHRPNLGPNIVSRHQWTLWTLVRHTLHNPHRHICAECIFVQQQRQQDIIGEGQITCAMIRKLKIHQQHPLICTVIGLQGSHAGDEATLPGSNARATPNSTQTSSRPGSTDESWQSSHSDHHRPDLTCDRVRHLCATCSQLLAGCIHYFEPYFSCMHIDTLLSQCAYTCLVVIVVAEQKDILSPTQHELVVHAD